LKDYRLLHLEYCHLSLPLPLNPCPILGLWEIQPDHSSKNESIERLVIGIVDPRLALKTFTLRHNGTENETRWCQASALEI